VNRHPDTLLPFHGGHKPRVLVVDDQPVNIQVIYQILANEYQVFMATSGSQALTFCQKTPPDLILLDIAMPQMDGLETCRKLKEQPQLADIPIIFVTSLEQQAEENQCWQVGGSDFILKPVNHVTLKNRVRAQITLKQQNQYLKQLAFIDGLTNLWNRRFADDYLARQLSLSHRQQHELTLMMIDIDLFKQYNDHFGHLQGDDCLKSVCQLLASCLKRPSDVLARFGGEEFICILPGCKWQDAELLGQVMVQAVADGALPHPLSPYRFVTVSIGLASTGLSIMQASELIATADQALYQAKDQGRHRCVAAKQQAQTHLLEPLVSEQLGSDQEC
jgi:diguanylate cyclase (GGDEF)-like protein